MAVEISIARGLVRVCGIEAPISGHTLALALYLAYERRPLSRERIAQTIFQAATRTRENAVKVYVHRLRAAIGKDAVVRKAGGYTYSSAVWIDLPAIEAIAAGIAHAPVTDAVTRARAARMLADLTAGRPDCVLRWDWFKPVEQHLQHLERRIRAAIAKENGVFA